MNWFCNFFAENMKQNHENIYIIFSAISAPGLFAVSRVIVISLFLWSTIPDYIIYSFLTVGKTSPSPPLSPPASCTYRNDQKQQPDWISRAVADTYNKKSRAKYTGLNLVHLQGLEPRTHWLRVSCSTNWAKGAYLIKWKSTLQRAFYLAGVVGIEPTSKVLETPILPLNHTPIGKKLGTNKIGAPSGTRTPDRPVMSRLL